MSDNDARASSLADGLDRALPSVRRRLGASAMTQALLEIRSLSKSFPINEGSFLRRKVGDVVAVDDVNFDVFEGETLGCVGGSGSGKSTLGRLILNLIPADSGSVLLDGTDLVGLSATEMRRYRRGFQIVFQDPLNSLNPRRTVAENISRPLLNFDIPREEAKARVEELLDLVGLNPAHANRYPHEFSGGQCQRIGIARALALKPRFLFLDEPSALDVSIQAQILNLLKDLQDALNLTYLFVAHDLKIVKHFSDRIIVLYHGRIVEMGDSDEIYHNPQHPYTQSLLDSVLNIDGGDAWEGVARRTGVFADDEDRDSALRAAADARTGCIYAGTCSERFEPCASITPTLRETKSGHRVACHLYDSPDNASANADAAWRDDKRTNQHIA
jgi:ABC-type oligopeptide transport system ATPase subunit